jgi:hypothetical protein
MFTPRLTACRGYCAAGLPGQARSSAGPRPQEEAMNWLAIIVATVVNIGLGVLWFSPTLFQKPWMAMRVDKVPMSGTASPMLDVITAVAALVSAHHHRLDHRPRRREHPGGWSAHRRVRRPRIRRADDPLPTTSSTSVPSSST